MSRNTGTTRIIIAGGGTGGHLFPGLALADELVRRGAEVTFVGTERGIEAKAVPQAGYPLVLVDVAGLKRKGLLGALRSLLRLPLAGLKALRLLRRLRPRAVVGVGGYASGPVVLVAALLGIPSIVLEQNSVPGLTNRILGRFVRLVVTAFPRAEQFFPAAKVRLLGNPIRNKVLHGVLPASARPEDEPLRVLVLGGSQGAHAVNQLMTAAMTHWVHGGDCPPFATALRLRHQTGPTDREAVEATYRSLGLGPDVAQVDAFITDMGEAYADCDLMIGRAGATTIAELTAVGRPALLIPFPQAADDHQTHNARSMVDAGAAQVLPQTDTTPAQLAAAIAALCRDRAQLQRMSEHSRALGRPAAAVAIAEYVLAC